MADLERERDSIRTGRKIFRLSWARASNRNDGYVFAKLESKEREKERDRQRGGEEKGAIRQRGEIVAALPSHWSMQLAALAARAYIHVSADV